MAEKKNAPCGYAGRIKNSGSQHVEAPFKSSESAGGKSIRGRDLRCGKGGK